MPEIIPHIYKEKLDKGSSYLVKYSDIADCLSGRSLTDVYLDAYFRRYQHLRKEDRDRSKAEGEYKIVDCTHLSHKSAFRREHKPWSNKKDAYVVDCWIYAIPLDALNAAGLHRKLARLILARQIDEIAQGELPRHDWSIDLTLFVPKRAIECKQFIGTWQYGPRKIIDVLIDEVENDSESD
jgi:hypothetical protein